MAAHNLKDRLASIAELETLYGAPSQRSLDKELEQLSLHYQAFIEKAPFLVLATVGPEGVDCSPRGDPAGFVRVVDSKTLMLPDRKGNNRLDSLRNIVRQRRVSLLFLIPGVGETLRVNGHADIVVNAELNASFDIQGKQPRSVIVVTIDRVYFQCQKALARSRLWDPQARIDRTELPSTGEMLQAVSKEAFDGEEYDAGYSEHMKRTIY
jgi:PPOX class probable FMN-dependent enzyme